MDMEKHLQSDKMEFQNEMEERMKSKISKEH